MLDSEATHMSPVRRLSGVLPWGVLAAYCVLVVDYLRYLDTGLQYAKPMFARSPEDVLGFGFWPIWTGMLVLLVATGALAYGSVRRRAPYFISLVTMFVVVSAVDYYLYQTLATQLMR